MSTNKTVTLSVEQQQALAAFVAAFSAPVEAPVKAPRRPVTRKSGKAPARKVSAPAKVRSLCKATRLEFIAAARQDGQDFTGWSTRQIAKFCVDYDYAPKGFQVGAGYAGLVSGRDDIEVYLAS